MSVSNMIERFRGGFVPLIVQIILIGHKFFFEVIRGEDGAGNQMFGAQHPKLKSNADVAISTVQSMGLCFMKYCLSMSYNRL